MNHRDPDIVTASEIGSWAWCPESLRLESLGSEPANRAVLERGELSHARTAVFEARSRLAITLGWGLLVGSLLLAVLAFLLARG